MSSPNVTCRSRDLPGTSLRRSPDVTSARKIPASKPRPLDSPAASCASRDLTCVSQSTGQSLTRDTSRDVSVNAPSLVSKPRDVESKGESREKSRGRIVSKELTYGSSPLNSKQRAEEALVDKVRIISFQFQFQFQFIRNPCLTIISKFFNGAIKT